MTIPLNTMCLIVIFAGKVYDVTEFLDGDYCLFFL